MCAFNDTRSIGMFGLEPGDIQGQILYAPKYYCGGSQRVPINCGSYIRALTVGGHNACLLTAVVILHVSVLN